MKRRNRRIFNNKTVTWQYNYKLPLKRTVKIHIEMFHFY